MTKSHKSHSIQQKEEKSWSSVEHYFQGAKFKEINKSYYEKFALDSKSGLSRGNGKAAKKAGGKKGLPLSDSQRAVSKRQTKNGN